MTRHTPVYNLTVSYTASDGASKTLQISSPFTRWFDVDGFFIAKPFQRWLASEIPLVGMIDTKNNAKAIEGGKANGTSEATAVVVEQKVDTPRKATGSEMATPGTRGRKGRKAAER